MRVILAPRLVLPFLLLGPALASACSTSAGEVSDSPTPTTCPRLATDTTVTIPDPPDGPAECASGDCNYQTQEGCGDDQACRPQFNAKDPVVNPGCEPAGTHERGDECEAQADCARGLYCAAGICRKLCCGADWTGCDEGESCIRTLQVRAGGEVIDAGVDLCFPVGTCDVFDPESCSDDPARECKIVDPTGAVACAPRSTADVGDECGPPTVCKQGLNCVGGYCVKLCLHEECGEPACAETDGTCTHFERDPPGIGECTLGRRAAAWRRPEIAPKPQPCEASRSRRNIVDRLRFSWEVPPPFAHPGGPDLPDSGH